MSITGVGQSSSPIQGSGTRLNFDYDSAIDKAQSDLEEAERDLGEAKYEQGKWYESLQRLGKSPSSDSAAKNAMEGYRDASKRVVELEKRVADQKSRLDQLVAARDAGSAPGISPSSGTESAPMKEAVEGHRIIMLRSAITDKMDAVKQRNARIDELSCSPFAAINQQEIDTLKSANRTDLSVLEVLTSLYKEATSELQQGT